jgi:hypothetical protein
VLFFRVTVLLTVCVAAISSTAAFQGARTARARDWPVITSEMKPWTRWWWQGSAVDAASISAQLKTLRDAGLGGVEVTPIYGVRGAEDRFIPYLSGTWVQLLEHTVNEAARLRMGVDMATGTGWPFGGPWVDDSMAPRSMQYRTWTVKAGERLAEPIRMRQAPLVRAVGNQIHVVSEGAPGDPPPGSAQPTLRTGARALQIGDLVEPVAANKNLQELALEQVKYARDLPLLSLMAHGGTGQVLDLTSRVSRDGALDWTAPAGTWTLYALFPGWHGKLVERAAPGGEGNVIDHFSRTAIRGYLAAFDRAFGGRRLGLRAFFNDSYEVDDATGQADWTMTLLDEFEKRRGYDLRRNLPALFGRDTEDRNARVLADYRETISDLLLDTFTTEWIRWAHARRSIVRNQAHGAPASILDLYAASDIPETEGAEALRFKWATSAAHVAGRRLVSAEAATWLGEHFRTTLAEVRGAVDRFFLSGVNHIVYHGTAYSPADEPWPGWQFYAAVEFNSQNAWWDDFAALNQYVARTQSLLQQGRADNDVLLYYPLYDALAARGKGLLAHFGGAGPQADGAFEAAATAMSSRGFTYDFISDRQLRRTRTEGKGLVTSGGGRYRVLILPAPRRVPLETLEAALALARTGATVVAFKGLPTDVAGLANLNGRRERLRTAVDALRFGPPDADGVSEARIGQGRILRGDDVASLLTRAGILRERMVDQSLEFARRRDGEGRIYFISNTGTRAVDGWVPLSIETDHIVVFDPMRGVSGNARVRAGASQSGEREVSLQIPAGGSLLVTTSSAPAPAAFALYEEAATPTGVPGPWTIRFEKGGPALPAPRAVERLRSWTELGDDDVVRFSGTARYSTTFARPANRQDAWALDLGQVRETARVRLNGQDLGTLIGPPYRVVVMDAMLGASNTLEVSVTNLSANRIADLDRRGVPWKKFYNVNFPARLPENRGADGLFTAARWKPLESGLLGPVTLTPLRVAN